MIAANQSGNGAYAAAPQVTLDIVVAAPQVQAISFGSVPALGVYGFATVSASASSGLPVSFRTQTPSVCAVASDTGTVSDLASGTCIVEADQPGDAQFAAASPVRQAIVVAPYTGTITVPGALVAVTATSGNTAGTVRVSFTGPSFAGGSPITSFTVASVPPGTSATASASPISVACPSSCAGAAFSVSATNAAGTGAASAAADVVTTYDVVLTFYEPMTQPFDSVFTGSFVFDATTGTVSGLRGSLTESMTGVASNGTVLVPASQVALDYELSTVSDGAGGLVVTAFHMGTTNVFAPAGFAPSPANDRYYGYPSALNPADGGVGNAYAMIDVNLADPTATPSSALLAQLAYADCTALGMMGSVCMTGIAGGGSMGGYPLSQIITKP